MGVADAAWWEQYACTARVGAGLAACRFADNTACNFCEPGRVGVARARVPATTATRLGEPS